MSVPIPNLIPTVRTDPKSDPNAFLDVRTDPKSDPKRFHVRLMLQSREQGTPHTQGQVKKCGQVKK